MKSFVILFNNYVYSYKGFPVFSIIGFGLVLITSLVKIGFGVATDIGLQIILSTFTAILLLFTSMWSVMGLLELKTLIKAKKKINKELINEVIDKDTFRVKFARIKLCFIINISYIVTVLLQIGYVILNFEEINI